MVWFRKDDNADDKKEITQEYNTMNYFSRLNQYPKSGVSYIKMINFNSLNDLEMIQRDLQEGNIMVLNTEKLLDSRSILELKRAIDKLRGSCQDLGGSIGRIGDQFLVITPNPYIRISH
jgi:SepF-like predicted cell division protein (DUF552 family)